MANGGQNKRLTAITDGKTRATGRIRNTEGTKGLSCTDIMQCREPLRGGGLPLGREEGKHGEGLRPHRVAGEERGG
jgi:hypothetical protein